VASGVCLSVSMVEEGKGEEKEKEKMREK